MDWTAGALRAGKTTERVPDYTILCAWRLFEEKYTTITVTWLGHLWRDLTILKRFRIDEAEQYFFVQTYATCIAVFFFRSRRVFASVGPTTGSQR